MSRDICIGIDLGTTNSCVAVWQGGGVHVIPNDLGQNTTPSIVFYDPKNGTRTVGQTARQRLNRFPNSTFYCVKRMIGQKYQQQWSREFNYAVEPDENNNPVLRLPDDTRVRPEEVSAQVLIKMRQIAEAYLGHPVTRAVITVPAYFDDGQRSATKTAARIAGLEVARMINEPTAACLCYGLDQLESCSQVLVYDIGGGTLDVSLLSLNGGLFEVLATSGDCHLGGEDFDLALVEYFTRREGLQLKANSASRLKSACEDLKRQLSQTDVAYALLEDFAPDRDDPDLNLELSMAEFRNITAKLLARCMEPVDRVLSDAEVEASEIDQVVLVGGSTRIRAIQECLQQRFPDRPLNKSVNPDEAVAYGAAVQAAILNRQDDTGKTDQMVLVDVTPLSLGLETTGGIMSVVVPRNTSIPCEKSSFYTTVENNQTEVEIQVFQGERALTSDCQMLGTFRLTGIPPMVRGIAKIKVDFKLDSDGILNIKAVEETSGIEQRVTIDSDSTRLDETEIKRLILEADQSRARDEQRRGLVERRRQLVATLEDYLRMAEDGGGSLGVSEYVKLRELLNDLKCELNAMSHTIDADKLREIEGQIKNSVTPLINSLYNKDRPDQLEATNVEVDDLNAYLAEL